MAPQQADSSCGLTAERDCSGGFQSTSLMKAARVGQVEAIERALECSAINIDAVGADGRTALHIASAAGHLPAVHALMEAGADTATADGAGVSPEEAAAAAGHTEVAYAIAAEQAQRDAVWRLVTGAAAPQGATREAAGVRGRSGGRSGGQPSALAAALAARAARPQRAPAESPF